MSDSTPPMRELLGDDAPSNWGKWGPDDELGCLNYLDAGEVLRGVRHVRSGKVFTLQIHMGRTESPGDPLWPGREGIKRQNVMDEATWDSADAPQFPGGLHYADDTALIFLQGSTQYDALGHVWYDGKLWNGYDARSTVEAMDRASVLPIAEKGVVGRGCSSTWPGTAARSGWTRARPSTTPTSRPRHGRRASRSNRTTCSSSAPDG